MMLGNKERTALDELNRVLSHVSREPLSSDQNQSKLIQLLIDLYQDGSTWSTLNGEVIFNWALDNGWPEYDAITARDFCIAIYETLLRLGMISL